MRGLKIGSLYKTITIILFALIFFLNNSISAYAGRVYGNGSVHSGFNANRPNNYIDPTIKPPLGHSWKYTTSSAAPTEKGITLTNYRIYFGDGNTLNGFSDQVYRTKINRTDPLESRFRVGNPFQLTYSGGGSVTSSLEQYSDGTELAFYFGTSDGRVGRLYNTTLDHYNGEQRVTLSPQIPAMGAIREIVQNGNMQRVLTMSDSQLVNYDAVNNSAIWWYYLTDKTLTPGRFSGITNFTPNNTYSNVEDSIVVTDNGVDEGWGLIFNGVNNAARTGWQKWNYEIRYNAGIPKHVAYDSATQNIYAIDREGRFYVHNKQGQLQHGTFFYAGDHTTRGYDSVGGVMLTDNYAFVSTLGSTQSLTSRGTITRFDKLNPSVKATYVHESAITTTPYLVSGLLYFGDENGKIWAMNPDTMQLVNWYLDESLSTPRAWYDVGTAVHYILGADNHMIAATDTTIDGFKGRPDFIVSATVNPSNADLNGNRYNFTTSPSEVAFTNHIYNAGTFDYNVYDDFLGKNHQRTNFSIRNTDNYTYLSVNNANISASNVAPSEYQSNSWPTDPRFFQVGAGMTGTQSYRFTPPTEGKYEIITRADSDGEQQEFNEGNNSRTSIIDVVDMRKPTAQSNKTIYKPNETATFTLNKTQLYSFTKYIFEIFNENWQPVYYKESSTFETNQSFSTSYRGKYYYRVSIDNRYGDRINGDYGTFDVVNQPPVANFIWNPSTLYNDTNVTFTNQSTDPDNDPLTYEWSYQEPGTTTWTAFSTAQHPSKLLNKKGTWGIKLVATDPYGEQSTAIKNPVVINRSPSVTLTYSPSTPYEGDTINVCAKPTDPDNDLLYVTLYSKKGSGTEQVVMTKGSVTPGTDNCYSFVSEYARYDFRVVVTDGQLDATASTWVQVKPLIIKGYVKHTSDWEKEHIQKGHLPSQFYSGETFILEADVSDYPIEYVNSTLNNALLVNQSTYTKTVPLSFLRALVYGGQLYEESFQEPSTSLTKGPKEFIFEVKYKNGVVKRDTVPIEIIGDVLYDGYQFHRRY